MILSSAMLLSLCGVVAQKKMKSCWERFVWKYLIIRIKTENLKIIKFENFIKSPLISLNILCLLKITTIFQLQSSASHEGLEDIWQNQGYKCHINYLIIILFIKLLT